MLRVWVTLTLGLLLWPASATALFADNAEDAAEDAEKSTAAAARTAELIEQLGDRRFRVRRQAAESLRQIGLPAIEALRKAVTSPDLEVRVRAAGLLEDVERLDHERRLQAFLADPDSRPDGSLPGWKRYRESIGDDRTARELFVEMQRAEPKLFRMLEPDGKELTSRYATRCIELQSNYAFGHQRKAALGSVCALLFVGGDAAVTMSEQTARVIYNFANYSEFTSALTRGARVDQMRKLLGGWIARPGGEAAYQRTRLAMRHNLREGLVPALEVIGGGAPNHYLQYAILAVGKLGGRDYVPALEKLLDNQAVLGTRRTKNRPISTCEVRDVALAVILHLTGQDPKQYGFGRLRKESQYLFALNSAGFEDEAGRKAAFEKWAAWKAVNPAGAASTEKSPPARTEER